MVTLELRVKNVAEAKGILNPHALHQMSGVPYSVCYRMWQAHQTRLDLLSLLQICVALQVTPGELIVLVKTRTRKTRKSEE